MRAGGHEMKFGRGLFSVLALTLCWQNAGAQTPPPQPFTGAIQIVAVTPAEISAAESRVVLSFNQLVPKFTIVGNDANMAAIAFADTRLVPGLLFPGGKHGLIQSMTFSQS